MKKYLLTIALFGILLGGAILIYNRLNSGPEYKADLAYSSFIKQVKTGRIERVEITGKTIKFRTSAGEDFETYNPGDPHLIDDLLATGAQIRTTAPNEHSLLMEIFISWFPMLVLIVICSFFMHKMQKNSKGSVNFGFQKNKAKMFDEDQVKITFADVAGCEEAKEDVVELV
ncbi:MAG: ATP-dependent metallopeptidase FtsH/Yme1/Tma family protein, partial [Methylococcaceae bacterium]|nr:ATP-dependent metallopeptidase FtsH/Yme1/Tma family protein [Methylococcaceae bacterium]